MVVKNVNLQLVGVKLVAGKAKESGKDYSFYQATVLDDEANVYKFILDRVLTSKDGAEKLLEFKNVPIIATLRFFPKGFDLSAQIVDFELE